MSRKRREKPAAAKGAASSGLLRRLLPLLLVFGLYHLLTWFNVLQINQRAYWKRVALSSAGAHFLLAGAGADSRNSALLAELREAGVLHCTRLLGARTDMPRVMAALDIATSASYSEGFPNVIGEAMCCALPCVVTDTGDSAWLVGAAGIVRADRGHRRRADVLE